MPMSVRDASAWKAMKACWVRDASAWKEVKNIWVRDASAWKLAYEAQRFSLHTAGTVTTTSMSAWSPNATITDIGDGSIGNGNIGSVTNSGTPTLFRLQINTGSEFGPQPATIIEGFEILDGSDNILLSALIATRTSFTSFPFGGFSYHNTWEWTVGTNVFVNGATRKLKILLPPLA